MQRQDRTVSQPAIARDLIELQCDSTASSKLLCPSLSQSVCLIGFNCCVQHWWRLLLASPLPAAALLPPALLLLAFMATWHAREQVVMISNVRQSGSPSPPPPSFSSSTHATFVCTWIDCLTLGLGDYVRQWPWSNSNLTAARSTRIRLKQFLTRVCLCVFVGYLTGLYFWCRRRRQWLEAVTLTKRELNQLEKWRESEDVGQSLFAVTRWVSFVQAAFVHQQPVDCCSFLPSALLTITAELLWRVHESHLARTTFPTFSFTFLATLTWTCGVRTTR